MTADRNAAPAAPAVDRGDIARLAEAATPGPWEWREDHGRDMCDEGWSSVRVRAECGGIVAETAQTYAYRPGEIGGDLNATDCQADAAFIAAARTAVPDLLSRLSAVEAERDAALAKIEAARDLIGRALLMYVAKAQPVDWQRWGRNVEEFSASFPRHPDDFDALRALAGSGDREDKDR